MCLYMSAPEAINNSGVIWTSYDLLNKLYSCYMATVVVIVNGRGLGISAGHRY